MSEKQHANDKQTPSISLLLLIILGAIGAVTPLAIDMYLPAMPVIADNLGVSDGLVQMTLTAYMAGFAIGQLLHGPLSDTFSTQTGNVGWPDSVQHRCFCLCYGDQY